MEVRRPTRRCAGVLSIAVEDEEDEDEENDELECACVKGKPAALQPRSSPPAGTEFKKPPRRKVLLLFHAGAGREPARLPAPAGRSERGSAWPSASQAGASSSSWLELASSSPAEPMACGAGGAGRWSLM